MDNMQAIKKRLSCRRSLDYVARINEAGIYALYLKNGCSLANFPVYSDGLIYIGLSHNLADREIRTHFSSGGTGFSTVRRSLGAILKNKLDLTAIPRGNGRSMTNYRNYRFSAEGEDKLTAWINKNIGIGICINIDDIKSVEAELIAQLEPVLNLKGWANPHRAAIKQLRRACVCEALQ